MIVRVEDGKLVIFRPLLPSTWCVGRGSDVPVYSPEPLSIMRRVRRFKAWFSGPAAVAVAEEEARTHTDCWGEEKTETVRIVIRVEHNEAEVYEAAGEPPSPPEDAVIVEMAGDVAKIVAMMLSYTAGLPFHRLHGALQRALGRLEEAERRRRYYPVYSTQL